MTINRPLSVLFFCLLSLSLCMTSKSANLGAPRDTTTISIHDIPREALPSTVPSESPIPDSMWDPPQDRYEIPSAVDSALLNSLSLVSESEEMSGLPDTSTRIEFENCVGQSTPYDKSAPKLFIESLVIDSSSPDTVIILALSTATVSSGGKIEFTFTYDDENVDIAESSFTTEVDLCSISSRDCPVSPFSPFELKVDLGALNLPKGSTSISAEIVDPEKGSMNCFTFEHFFDSQSIKISETKNESNEIETETKRQSETAETVEKTTTGESVEINNENETETQSENEKTLDALPTFNSIISQPTESSVEWKETTIPFTTHDNDYGEALSLKTYTSSTGFEGMQLSTKSNEIPSVLFEFKTYDAISVDDTLTVVLSTVPLTEIQGHDSENESSSSSSSSVFKKEGNNEKYSFIPPEPLLYSTKLCSFLSTRMNQDSLDQLVTKSTPDISTAPVNVAVTGDVGMASICSMQADRIISVDLNQIDVEENKQTLVEGLLGGYTHLSIHIERPTKDLKSELEKENDKEVNDMQGQEWVHLCVDAEIQSITPLADFVRVPKTNMNTNEFVVKDVPFPSILSQSNSEAAIGFTLFGAVIIIMAGFLIAKFAVMRRRHTYTSVPSNARDDTFEDDDGIIEV